MATATVRLMAREFLMCLKGKWKLDVIKTRKFGLDKDKGKRD